MNRALGLHYAGRPVPQATHRLGVYAHYDPRGEVKDYVVYCLEALRPLCDRLIFVSTAPLDEEARRRARLRSDVLLERSNVGLDFGMWQAALSREVLADHDELLLVNSSVFGPLWDLAPIVARMNARACDFWGMTENFEPDWHLQSYFLMFKQPVLRSSIFADFWASVLPYRDKFQVIRSYEVGLSLLLSDAGFLGEAAVPNRALFPPEPWDLFYRYKRRNATCYYPERLLDRGMPFVKAHLLRDNPINIRLGPVWQHIQSSAYDERLIEFDHGRDGDGEVHDRFFRWLQRPLGAVVDRILNQRRSSCRNGAPSESRDWPSRG